MTRAIHKADFDAFFGPGSWDEAKRAADQRASDAAWLAERMIARTIREVELDALYARLPVEREAQP